jgi:hypothetical protein
MANEFNDETRPEALAFPWSYQFHEMYIHQGLTKREYYAAMAMQGVCANSIITERASHKTMAEWSVKQADALIEALNK